MRGLVISSGIAMGRVFHWKELTLDNKVSLDGPGELARLDQAIKEAGQDLELLYYQVLEDLGEKEADIFMAHRMMVEDPDFIRRIRESILEEQVRAEWALKMVTDEYVDLFEEIEDDFLRSRVVDLKDISCRIMGQLCPGRKEMPAGDLIVLAQEVNPSLIALEGAVGFLGQVGGPASHTAILSRMANKPYMTGQDRMFDLAKDGDFIIMDGNRGEIFLNPSDQLVEDYREEVLSLEAEEEVLRSLDLRETRSLDGEKIGLLANITSPADVDEALRQGAEGIGLYRTEFLYMNRSGLPSEEEQFLAYRQVAEAMEGRPLVIRTLDIGGDKELDYLKLPREANPFLGYRAIRVCLDQEDIFKTQLRAILRASTYGDIRLMFPMISSLGELRMAKAILERVKEDLRGEGIAFREDMELGMMVEVPGVAIQGDVFAREVDFFSIGSNDLIQYTLAVDRGNQRISALYDGYHPAVLRLIKLIIEHGHREGIWVGICGELASNLDLIPLFLAMGMDEFSMNSRSILRARELISKKNKRELEAYIDQALALSTGDEVREFLRKM